MENLLIVEDYGLVRAGMVSLLRKAAPQYLIHEEGTYEGAIKKLSVMQFDLVFLDIDLGTVNSGLDVLKFVREKDLSCRVIMLSGSDDFDIVLSCISHGASGYIPKASQEEGVFERAIATVLDQGVYLPTSTLKRSSVDGKNGGPIGCSVETLGLAPRHCEVLYYICQGLPNKAIANRMGITEGTVRKSYVSNLLNFFGVARRTELIIEVSRRRLKLYPPA